jgi:hypothetical protein
MEHSAAHHGFAIHAMVLIYWQWAEWKIMNEFQNRTKCQILTQHDFNLVYNYGFDYHAD